MKTKTIGGIEVTPELLAKLFWEMYSDEQADFFAALEEIASHSLCQQMAYVVAEIHKRADKGDHRAQNGLQTMLNHASDFVAGGIDSRVWDAKYEIRQMAERAKVSP